MDAVLILVKTRLTAQDYLEQYPVTSQPMELIDGDVVAMPAPLDRHSDLVSNIMWVLLAHVKPQKLGKVKTEPTDVHFDDHNILQPDVFFIHRDNDSCRVEADGYLHGTPDLCIEILSPRTAHLDQIGGKKYLVYEQYGVREYWIIDPEEQTVQVFSHTGQKFIEQGHYLADQAFTSTVLPDLTVQVSAIFEGLV